MPSVVNKCIVRDIKESLEKASSVTLAQFDKVSVKEMESFKKKLGSKGSWCQVMKNRLLKIALKEKGMDLPGEMCQLSSLAVMSEGEIVDYAKILVDFAKKNKSVKIKCGLMDEKLISSDDFVRISNLPSREVLLSTVFSALQGPILGFATVLSGVLRNFVGVVKAIEDKKREQGDAVEEKEEPKEAKQDGAAGEKD